MVLTFLLRDKTNVEDAALALTFERRTMTTHIVVFWEREDICQDTIFKKLSRGIEDPADLADHLALCLIVIAFHNHERCESELRVLEDKLSSLNKETLEKNHDPDRSANIQRTRSFYDDIEDLKLGLNGIAFSKAFAVKTVRAYLLRYERRLRS